MNTVKTGFLMMLMGGLLLVVGQLIGGFQGLIFALIFAVALNFFAYWFSDKMALRMAGAHQVSPEEAPELHTIVDEQVMRAKIPKPKVYIIQNDSPNAFATGRSPKKATIAATTGIMNLLNREELGGVIAHELAHVGNRDTLIMTMVATVASAIGMIAWMAKFSLIFGGFGGFGGRDRGGRRGRVRNGHRHRRPSPFGHCDTFAYNASAPGYFADARVPGRRYGGQDVGESMGFGQRLGEIGQLVKTHPHGNKQSSGAHVHCGADARPDHELPERGQHDAPIFYSSPH